MIDYMWNLGGTELPLDAYDAVEVMEVELNVESGDIYDARSEGFKNKDPECFYFWSVYLRRKPEQGFGGVDCIADVPTKEAAYALAAGLEVALRSVIGDALVPMKDGIAAWRQNWTSNRGSGEE